MRARTTTLITILFCLLCHAATLRAQHDGQILCMATVVDGDTIPYFTLNTVNVKTVWSLLSKEEIRKNQRLIRNVKKTMPYAKEAKRRLQELDRELASMNPKVRKEYVKEVEKELLAEFRDDLEDLTLSQGKVLLKLVDRETGNTSYNLVADLRGKLRASFYQTFARLFGFNLKAHYDPKHNKDDAFLERVARSVETGRI